MNDSHADASMYQLPDGLPVPEDDGGADHLVGRMMPKMTLGATEGIGVELGSVSGIAVFYIYPRTGNLTHGENPAWNAIPGARGCTPQACGFRDHYAELQKLGAQVFGISAQSTLLHREVVSRLHLPYLLLSDSALEFAAKMGLPLFTFEDHVLLKRLTIIARDGLIEKVFYPVWPPQDNAQAVIDYLTTVQP